MKARAALALLVVLAGCARQGDPRVALEARSAAGTLADGTASVTSLRIASFADPRTRTAVARRFGADAADRSHAFQGHLKVELEGTGRAPRELEVAARDFATESEAGPYCDLRIARSNFPGDGIYIVKVEANLSDGRVLTADKAFQYVVSPL